MQIYSPIRKNKEKVKINKLKIAGITFGILILFAVIYYCVFYSPIFKIKEINISGLPDYSKKDLEIDLKNFFIKQSKISSWLGGNNIIAWNSNIGEFLKENPRYKELSVSKNYFSRKINITAKERERFGLWCPHQTLIIDSQPLIIKYSSTEQSTTTELVNNNAENSDKNSYLFVDNSYGSFCWWFDESGIIFYKAPQIESELFYRISDYSNRKTNLGDAVLPKEMFLNLKKIFSVLDKENLNTKTVILEDMALEEVSVKSETEPKTLFSLKLDPQYSISAINALKKSGAWQKLNYVDFRVENRAYYK